VIECDDGSIQLTIPVSHHAEIMMQILGHGSEVRVLQPDWLKEKTAEEIERMSRLY
jgi:predicted DNA-binding transcriptional regulator YafY